MSVIYTVVCAKSEWDALQFEVKMAPSNTNLQWWEWLHES